MKTFKLLGGALKYIATVEGETRLIRVSQPADSLYIVLTGYGVTEAGIDILDTKGACKRTVPVDAVKWSLEERRALSIDLRSAADNDIYTDAEECGEAVEHLFGCINQAVEALAEGN